MPAELKFCVDCKHHFTSAFSEHFCARANARSMVTGAVSNTKCYDERFSGDCGPDAKNFKPKLEANK